MQLYNGDCLEVMKQIPDKSIDLILTDPPYGTTNCKWDSVIPFEKMWPELERIVKDNAAIVLFGSEPFSSALRMSNIGHYKYEWVWNKHKPGNFLLAKIQPLRIVENVMVFSKTTHNYYPIMTKNPVGNRANESTTYKKTDLLNGIKSGVFKRSEENGDKLYPKCILDYSNANNKDKVHPTQKPVALLEYLIKTYTKESETVLDFTMGSGSTGVAAVNTYRDFIGIEIDKHYFEIAKKRIEDAEKERAYSLFEGAV